MTYREPEVKYPLALISAEKPLHPGKRLWCPACDAPRSGNYSRDGNRYYSTGCAGLTPCFSNWFSRLFGACKERRRHFHQSCYNCNATWIVGWKCDDEYVL